MKKPILVIKLKVTQFSAVKTLAQSVYKALLLNPNFLNPQPALPTLLAAANELEDNLAKWGEKGNRGSHADYVNLQASSARTHLIVTQLAAWCMSSLDSNMDYPAQAVILSTSGFRFKKACSPQGVLEEVRDLHRFRARYLNDWEVKLSWAPPLNVSTITNIDNYLIFRGTSSSFLTARFVAASSKTSYIDSPDIGDWFYFVVAVNNKGNGALASPVFVQVFVNA